MTPLADNCRECGKTIQPAFSRWGRPRKQGHYCSPVCAARSREVFPSYGRRRKPTERRAVAPGAGLSEGTQKRLYREFCEVLRSGFAIPYSEELTRILSEWKPIEKFAIITKRTAMRHARLAIGIDDGEPSEAKRRAARRNGGLGGRPAGKPADELETKRLAHVVFDGRRYRLCVSIRTPKGPRCKSIVTLGTDEACRTVEGALVYWREYRFRAWRECRRIQTRTGSTESREWKRAYARQERGYHRCRWIQDMIAEHVKRR